MCVNMKVHSLDTVHGMYSVSVHVLHGICIMIMNDNFIEQFYASMICADQMYIKIHK